MSVTEASVVLSLSVTRLFNVILVQIALGKVLSDRITSAPRGVLFCPENNVHLESIDVLRVEKVKGIGKLYAIVPNYGTVVD